MSRFSWCLDGHHEDCPERIPGEEGDVLCTCPCHGNTLIETEATA